MIRPPRPFDALDAADIGRVLDAALEAGARFAEIFIERRVARRLVREEGRLRAPAFSVECGAGVRAVSGRGFGCSTTCDPDVAALLAAARSAGRMAAAAGASGGGADLAAPPGGPSEATPETFEPGPDGIGVRAAWLEEVDARAHRHDSRVVEVSASIAERARTFFVANTAGRVAADSGSLTGASVSAFVRGPDGVKRGRHGGGGPAPFSRLATDRLAPRALAEEAVRRAIVQIDAAEAPTGEMPVVIGNGWGGVLLHEAIGHGFEADFVRRGTSIFSGRLGQAVASAHCTVVDDGSVPGLRGSFGVDDEGTPPGRTVLIERGVLRGFLHDLTSAAALGASPTGNGRRESFRSPPIPRQSNLFLEAGEPAPEEILRGVARGLYARNLGGGQVDIVNGNFVFEVIEGYLIEGGRVGSPVRGASLIGRGPDVLARIAAVGSDFAFDPGIGTCGKDGQSAPVGVGQPTVLVSAMTVGGTRL